MMIFLLWFLVVSVRAFFHTTLAPQVLLRKRARTSPLAVPYGSQRASLASNVGELDLNDLNPSQRAAVTAPLDQPVRVIAGPGSGKTRVLVSSDRTPCLQLASQPFR